MKKGILSSFRIFICCVVAVLLILAMIMSSYIIREELEKYVQQTLSEISVQNANAVSSRIDSDLVILSEIADRISYDDEFDITVSGLQSSSENYGYKRMEIVYLDGSVVASDNRMHDIFSEDHVQFAFNGEANVSDVHSDSSDGTPIFTYSVPVYNRTSGEITAVLVAVSDTESFKEHLAVSAFDGQEYTYIVKANGMTVIDSNHGESYKKMENLFSAMKSVGDNDDIAEKMQADMSAGKSDCVKYKRDGASRYVHYSPLPINDWYIISAVSSDVIDGGRFRIMLIVYVMFAVMIVTTIIFVLSLLKSEMSKKAELERILYTDELTGGMSFSKFCIDAQERLEEVHKSDGEQHIACVMTDIENFRLINNLYGRLEGTRTILSSFRALSKILDKDDLLARQASDRYYALIIYNDRNELDDKLRRYIKELKYSEDGYENEYIINPSIGVYIADVPGEEIETIINNASIAHDTADKRGERIVFYDDEHRDRLKTIKMLEDRMELAHQNNEFIPYFQPKYSAETGEICGAEALVRWKNPDGSITMPNSFIPIAESNGFIRVLDRDVFNAVCKFQKDIIESGGKCVPISVNVSRQLMYEQNFASDYINTLKKYDLSPELVELEITESVLFEDQGVFRQIIDTLRNNGFKILMDDFGTGYSSLMMLSTVPIDNIKLDKSLIDGFEEEKGRKIIISVIELAKSLQLPLTAEGVETRNQFDFLKDMGCNIIQGFYFSKPVPEESFREMLKK